MASVPDGTVVDPSVDESSSLTTNENADAPTSTVSSNKRQKVVLKGQSNTTTTTLCDVPLATHYHVSWMHAHVITCVAVSRKHGYVVTGDEGGVVKFWKRLSPPSSSSGDGGNNINHAQSSTAATQDRHPSSCLEFAKSYTAHADAVRALSMDTAGDVCVSVGWTSTTTTSNTSSPATSNTRLQFYDVATFDAVSRTDLPHCAIAHTTWVTVGTSSSSYVVAANGAQILLVDPSTGRVAHTVSLHAAPVTAMANLPWHGCAISTDAAGSVQVWDCGGGAAAASFVVTDVGGPVTPARHGVVYDATTGALPKGLYTLVRKRTHAVAVVGTRGYYALACADRKVRVLEHATGLCLVSFDESLAAHDALSKRFGLDAMEYGKRSAVEREIQQGIQNSKDGKHGQGAVNTYALQQRQSIQFDETGRYLLVCGLLGIKVLDWKKKKLVGICSASDAGSLRFCSCVLAQGTAMVNLQMQLARGGVAVNSVDKEESTSVQTDTLLLALAYQQRRLYVTSHQVIEPADMDSSLSTRDVWNEAPTRADQVKQTLGAGATRTDDVATKAILRTTMGDIAIALYSQVPKTLENFCGHCKSGYYDNVLFHRVISGFMLQTGDPLGDGTGGESIWGGEFEDEIVPQLRHDRPFTVSMANAGPGTNGSQFFITTVPTPWLDGKHTVFGRVMSGMDICTLIEKVKTDDGDKPLDDVRIHSVDLE